MSIIVVLAIRLLTSRSGRAATVTVLRSSLMTVQRRTIDWRRTAIGHNREPKASVSKLVRPAAAKGQRERETHCAICSCVCSHCEFVAANIAAMAEASSVGAAAGI